MRELCDQVSAPPGTPPAWVQPVLVGPQQGHSRRQHGMAHQAISSGEGLLGVLQGRGRPAGGWSPLSCLCPLQVAVHQSSRDRCPGGVAQGRAGDGFSA